MNKKLNNILKLKVLPVKSRILLIQSLEKIGEESKTKFLPYPYNSVPSKTEGNPVHQGFVYSSINLRIDLILS
jgi:hypothetical protein